MVISDADIGKQPVIRKQVVSLKLNNKNKKI